MIVIVEKTIHVADGCGRTTRRTRGGGTMSLLPRRSRGLLVIMDVQEEVLVVRRRMQWTRVGDGDIGGAGAGGGGGAWCDEPSTFGSRDGYQEKEDQGKQNQLSRGHGDGDDKGRQEEWTGNDHDGPADDGIAAAGSSSSSHHSSSQATSASPSSSSSLSSAPRHPPPGRHLSSHKQSTSSSHPLAPPPPHVSDVNANATAATCNGRKDRMEEDEENDFSILI